jgi:outer membrane lipoprotein-sorting protein
VSKPFNAAIGFFIAAFIPIAAAQNAELSVEQIVQKHTEALGGLNHLRAIQTVKAKGSAILMGGQLEAQVTMEAKRPTLNRMEMIIHEKSLIQAFDGNVFWSVNPFTGDGEPQKASEEESKAARDDADFVDGSLVDYKAKGNQVELVGKEDVEGASAYKLKVTKKSGSIEFDFLDAKTFLPVKSSGQRKEMGRDFEFESFPRDFREVSGVKMPFQLEQRAEGKPVLQLAFDEIVANTPIEDSDFRMPEKPAASKP